ncbi:MAG TPA: hypothetical protein VJU81_11865 [Methylomirabilota bacterium]|nr:hypothetical protein [Methylomirabilota bacterium]
MASRWQRWIRELRKLLRPGPPPPGTLAITLALLAVTGTAIAILVALGLRHAGDPSAARYFGEGRAGNYFSGFQLGVAAVAGARVAVKVGRHPSRSFWWIIAATMLFLGLDEAFGLHEDLDVGIHKLMGWRDRQHWLTDHLDDGFVALYGLIAVVFAERHLERIVRLRWTAWLLAVAFVLFVVTSALDFSGAVAAIEESFELVAESLIVSALLTASRDPNLTAPE